MVATRAELFSSHVIDGQPLLSVKDVSVWYGDTPVLQGVAFDILAGQLVALMGENGAGKSTVVRCVVGDLVPATGQVLIAGSPVRSTAVATGAGVSVVWQDAALCDNLDVSANVFLGRERGRMFVSESKANQATNALLASYGIKVSSSRAVGTLSSGQRQLIAVAKAMRNTPRLLVLDEPTASLGVPETRQVEELIGRLKRSGTTVLLISHDVEQVFRLADRVLVLHRGRIAADLAPPETNPEEVVAIMSGHPPNATARHQLSRLQYLVDQLASAKPNSSLPLIISALGSALSTGQLCIHLLEDRSLRLVAASGLPAELLAAWSSLPVGAGGGPPGAVAGSRRVTIDEDVLQSAAWTGYSGLARRAGIRSSWAVPLISPTGLIGVLTGCSPKVGRPQRDQMDLVSLYAGYAAGAIDRDRLFGEVTARNRVLETIREVLEVLAGPEPVSTGLLDALRSLQRGLRAMEVELWLKGDAGAAMRCVAFVDADNQAHREPPRRDGTDAAKAFVGAVASANVHVLAASSGAQAIAVTFEAPGAVAALVARWGATGGHDDAVALLEDAARSVRLALERDEAEQAHQQAAALRRSHQLQRDFLSRLSHELRTPLTAIRGYATSLLAPDVTWDEESKLRFLDRIASESARMGRLVGDLLDFSAIESGLLRLQQDWCDLPLVIAGAVSCLPPDRALAIDVDCPPALGPVWADHDRLEQVFVNLLDNALRHNGPDVEVKVKVFLLGEDKVGVRVADNGQGIPAEMRPQLLDAQARGAISAQGAGLGVSIARGIVTAHGGEMTIEDVPEGTSFLVVLPVEGSGEPVG
ncbi:MAG TPA: ATP-binding cassette domain-containing protein [Acidimicrobiales bacterium]|nr:ATP-binding cassette domain-containing protein [Acidimicrobiales bacterium]